jgi:hypothetical protein
MKREGLSPLGQFLIEEGIRQLDFAERLTKVRGVVTRQSQVSEWATGTTAPADHIIVAIEKAAGRKNGEHRVPRQAWECWRRRHPEAIAS